MARPFQAFKCLNKVSQAQTGFGLDDEKNRQEGDIPYHPGIQGAPT